LATNKDKLLESAQKNLKKKQIAKAIKDYAKIVELDPVDIRSRQKLAELYVRTNKNTEAYEQYEAVAKYFSTNGFYLKAIAIYKQMQRLDPGQIALFNRLAELNEKQGLTGNALSEYRNLVDYYGRNGMIADEIKTLEKMRDIDLNNLNIRVKLAEIYARNERKDEGYSELESVLEILSEKGDFDKILRLYKMFLPFYPNNKELQMGLALAFFEKSDFGRGVTILEKLIKDKPEDPDIYELTGDGDKLLDIITERDETANEILIDETLSDSLLGIADEDISDSVVDLELTDENSDLSFDIVEEDSIDLELEQSLDSNSTGAVAETDSIIELDIDDSLDLVQAKDDDLDLSFDLGDDSSDIVPPAVEHNLQADLEEAEFYIQQGLYVEAEKLCRDILAYDSGSIECAQKLEEIESLLNQDQVSPTVEPKSSSLSPAFDGLSDSDFDFDLDSLQTDEAVEKKIFKTDVDEQIAADDMESHYNLGIAYREMGLLDDAISEFEKAEREPARYVDCQTLKGLSFSDKQDYEKAELMFQQALDSPELEAIQRLNLGYELGLLYERAERTNDALISYQNVFSQDSNYRDVRDKVSLLKETLGIDDDSQVVVEEKKNRISFL